MKTLIATRPRVAELVENTTRNVKDDEIKIAVSYASPKHGTEVIDFRGLTPFMEENFSEDWRMFTPREENEQRGIAFGEFKLGNMVVGTVTEKGDRVTEYQLGEYVCTYGAISEEVIVPAVNNPRLRRMPADGKWQNAVCYDPAQYALSGVRDAQVRPGDFTVVIGLGAIGQIAIQMAKLAGAELVIGVDPLVHRRDIALKNGADVCLDPKYDDIGFELKRTTDKAGVDSVIETSGNAHALQDALKGLGYGGIISYVAFAKGFSEGLNFGREAHFNNAKIVFSRAASEPNPDHPRWDKKRIENTCWKMLMSGDINCVDIIDPIVPFPECDAAYMKYVDRHPELSIKMGIQY